MLPVVMLAIGACTFAGLSTFQSIYAETRGLSPNVFFLTFTVTTVTLRFSVAGMIGKLPLGRLALTLFVTTLIGIGLLVLNPGSELLYVVATVLFAIGYGLTYSTLNAMVVNLAGERGLSISTASQVFTLAYFRGFVSTSQSPVRHCGGRCRRQTSFDNDFRIAAHVPAQPKEVCLCKCWISSV